MEGKDTLDAMIIGRIDPHIYAFRTNTVPDYLKVGDTYRPVSVRLNEWRQIFPNLQHLDEWKWVAKTDDNKYFRDFAVHYYLEEIKKLHRLQPNDIPNLPYYSKEFFQNATPEDIDAAILDIESKASQVGGPYHFYTEDRLLVTEHYKRELTYPLRPNQKATVKKFKAARDNGRRNLLMYAVMRFGKSFTSMWCATEMQAKTVLIVSAKADVKSEWKRTVESHVHFEDYTFIDSQALLIEPKAISNLLRQNKRAAIFLTLQDLMGDELKDKHKDIFKNQIDLLIVDETHFGARAEEYGKVLRNAQLSDKQIKKELSQADNTFEDLEEGLDVIKKLKVDTTIHLSGTPYRILMGSEFKPEDIIAFYQFTDIIDDKEAWDKKHLKDEDEKKYEEWENPYYGFPQMIRFAFNPNESARRMLEQLKEQGKTASLSELFRPASISIDTSSKKGHLHFAHEQEVLDLLQIIDGSKEEDNILGFLDYKKIKDGSMCHHIVCVLPYCASCDAFEHLLKKHKSKFKNLSQYEIVNISGIENNQFAIPEQIKQRIAEIESNGNKSITLTVNRMLTGSTVKEWDTMLFLKDVSSPQEYDQAIYRLQNQYIKTFKDDDGNLIRYNMKPQTLLVDFDPNRMFVMQEQKSKIYNVNTEERGNEELEERIRKELKISPIIVINKGKITEVTPIDVMDAVRNYSSSRTVMDEAREIPTDYNLLQDPQIRLLIDGLEPINAEKGLNIKPIIGEGDDLEDDGDDSEPIPGDTPYNTSDSGDSATTQPQEKDDADKRLATYFAQILFFALLTDDKVDSLKEIIQAISRDIHNKRIAHNVGLKSSSLNYLYRGINPFILQDLDYKIKNINEIVRDTSIEPLERVERALKKFGRLSISEIVTPSKVADDIIALLPEQEITESTRFLDIASKEAEFACALYRRFGDKVKNNIVSLPTSALTYEFTRKVYSLLDFPIKNIIQTFNSYELIGENKEIYTKILKNMKFDVIVGNPPYQEKGKLGGKGDAPIYQYFASIAKTLADKYVSMIIPSKWYTAGSERLLRDFRKDMLTSKNISKMIAYADANDVFPKPVEIKGGICYFLEDINYQGNCDYTYIAEDKRESDNVELDGLNLFIRVPRVFKIVKNIYSTEYSTLSEIISSDTPFGFPSNVKTSKKRPFDVKEKKNREFNTAIYLIEKGKERKIEYVRRKDVKKNVADIDKWKVLLTEAGGSGNDKYILGKPVIAKPNSVCTQSYLYIPVNNEIEAQNLLAYVKTKFLRFLVSSLKITQHAQANVYKFVPLQDFTENSDIDWSKSSKEIDAQLYKKYKLTKEEISFIESTIKPMD